MKEIILSDHVGDQVRKRESKRQGEYQSKMSRYKPKRARRQAAFRRGMPILMALFAVLWAALFFALWQAADGMRVFAAADGEFVLTTALSSLALAGLLFLIGYAIYMFRDRPMLEESGESENIWRAGKEGEDRVAAALHRILGDEWTLLRGYKNPAGEIDQVLVGPPGVVAIEVKYINGKIHISGDRWTRDRYDNYGNLVESDVPIRDGGGRSPAAQLNASASRLQRFLNERSSGAGRVSTAVVLAHDKSEISWAIKPSVNYAFTLNEIHWKGRKNNMFSRPARFDRNGAGQLVNLIQRDHQYHANGGGRGTRPKQRRQAARRG